MERTTLSFSIPNLVTVWIMLALGFFVLALGSQFLAKWMNKGMANAGAGGNTGSY